VATGDVIVGIANDFLEHIAKTDWIELADTQASKKTPPPVS